MHRSLIAVLTVLLSACGAPSREAQTDSSPPQQSAVQGPKVDELPAIDPNAVLAQIKVLASDEYEGRAPGTKGEELTVAYLEKQFRDMGLKPGNTDGTFVQKVPLIGITPAANMPLVIKGKKGTARLRYKDDHVSWTKRVAPTVAVSNSELVFVGYGIEAPEFQWDDYKGLDAKGKTLVMLINDPQVPAPDNPAELDPNVFGGRAMTYYGRWTYKFDIGARKNADGVLLIHETGPAGYPFEVVQGNMGEKFDLVMPDKNMGRVAVEGWITLDQGRKLLADAGHDFDALKKQATTRDFKPVPLGAAASITIRNKFRHIESRNVAGKLEGSDPRLKDEYVIYTAHWDHLGIGPERNGDQIYNGAEDNASGTAGMLEIARAMVKIQPPPKRSILLLAVTAEEQGLLGAQHYSVTPIYPLAKTLANINMDGLNLWGRTKDITVVGYGASDLDDHLREAAAEQGRVLIPDPEPEKGFYYRSDHFNFAKQGVPALYTDSGVDYINKPADYGKQKRDNYTANDYHKPSDEVKPDWDLSGAAEDLRLLMAVGYRVAQAAKFPEWKRGNEFRAIREKALSGGTN